MSAIEAEASEISILNRILGPDAATLRPETAKDILSWDFDEIDKDRMKALSAKARAGTLTAEEDQEAGRYETVGHLLNIMQSKARRSLDLRLDPSKQRGTG